MSSFTAAAAATLTNQGPHSLTAAPLPKDLWLVQKEITQCSNHYLEIQTKPAPLGERRLPNNLTAMKDSRNLLEQKLRRLCVFIVRVCVSWKYVIDCCSESVQLYIFLWCFILNSALRLRKKKKKFQIRGGEFMLWVKPKSEQRLLKRSVNFNNTNQRFLSVLGWSDKTLEAECFPLCCFLQSDKTSVLPTLELDHIGLSFHSADVPLFYSF